MLEFHPVNITLADGPAIAGWCTRQDHDAVLFFAHGNGFCGRVYQPLHELLAQKYDLLMLDIPGHGQTPESEFVGWNQTAEHLWQSIKLSDDFIAGRDLHAVGHSLGGMLSMLAASEHPETFKSMVMLDPIMFPPPLFFFMHVVHRLGLTSVFHPFVKPTLRRRDGWPDKQQAFSYFHNRKIFKGWTDEALDSYVQHALKQNGDEVRLCCRPELEARWFGTLPRQLWPSIKKLSVPVTIFMGQETYPFSLRAGRHAQKHNSSINYSVVPGGHCFMQEYPEQAASYVFTALEEHSGQQ